MKWYWIIAGCIFIFSCNSNEGYTKAEDAEEAGTQFIRASLDGNYDKAKFYLYKDSADFNVRLLDKWKMNYENMDKQEKTGYKRATIRPVEIKPAEDSSTYSYTYFNSYKKDTTTIRVLRVNDEWLVDLRDLH